MKNWNLCNKSVPELSGLVRVFGHYKNKRTATLIGKFDSKSGKFHTDAPSFTVTHWQALTSSSNCDTLPQYKPDETWAMSKEHILDTAYKMAQRDGFAAITRDGVAAEAGVAMGSVNHHYGTMQVLRDAVMQRAVEEEQLELIAQGIAMGDNVAKSAPLELRQRAISTLL